MMKKVFMSMMALVVCAAGAMADEPCPDPITATATVILKRKVAGALDGEFTVAKDASDKATKKVAFSKGNLQYNQSEDKWSFMEHQYSTVETTGMTIGTNYTSQNIVSLFGWVGGSSDLEKYGISTATSGYGTIDSETLKEDWGATMGKGWFTLTKDEWECLLKTRKTTKDGHRYAKANVGGINGLIILPDDWDDNLSLSNYDVTNAAFADNTIDAETWNSTWEPLGCVFLPAAGYRDGTDVLNVGSYGYYWSSSPYPSYADFAYYLDFYSGIVNPAYYYYRYYGISVRLVRSVE